MPDRLPRRAFSSPRNDITQKKICSMSRLKLKRDRQLSQILLAFPNFYLTAAKRGITPNCPCIIFALATAIDLLFLAPLSKNKTDSETFVFGTNLLYSIYLNTPY